MKKLGWAVLCLCVGMSSAWAEVRGKEVSYTAEGVTMKGWLAYDDAASSKRPAVLVVHEWWGHNAYARKRAEMLAQQGYVALAVDMYGDGKQAQHPSEAGQFAGEVAKNRALTKTRFEAGRQFLRSQTTVDGERMAAIGYCFGGSVVLNMAREGVDLKGVVSFHGGLATNTLAQPGQVKAQVRVFTGANDKMIPPDQVDAFELEMENAKVNYKVVVYPNTLHSFTNPDADGLAQKFKLPIAYNPAADKDSWAQATAFLAEVLKK